MESEDDMCGPSDAELDSEVEDMDGDDAEQELSVWLDQLNIIQQENGNANGVQKRHSRVALTPKMAMDSFRVSILESGGTQDVDLDAILGELCELETQLNTQQMEINTSIKNTGPTSWGASGVSPHAPHHLQHPATLQHPQHQQYPYHHQQHQHHPPPPSHSPSQRDSGCEPTDLQFQSASLEQGGMVGDPLSYGATAGDVTGGYEDCRRGDHICHQGSKLIPTSHQMAAVAGSEQPGEGHHDYDYPPTEDVMDPSQDTDSAYSDTISLPSSGSHISVTTTSSQNSGSSGSSGISSGVSPTAPGDYAARVKAEKVKLALDKIKEANIKKLFVRCYTVDGSSKSILVDENMTVAQVCDILVVKNHGTPSLHWAVVEQLPDLYMERMLEDHDNLVDNILMWSRDSTNKLIFLERSDKYDVFLHPEDYLLAGPGESRCKLDDSGRSSLVQEYFSPTSKRVPEMEGMLYLKAEGKKAWKRTYFVLRASGLYYNPKGKSKTSRDLVCLQQCDFVEIYTGLGWKKKYKAPTDHCFALKHPQIQKKAVKYIRYLCADDARSLRQWIAAIRIAKHGHQMLINFESVKNSIATWDSRDMAPHQDLVSLLAQPAPAHMAAMAAQKVVPGKEQVQNVPPSASCRIHGHRRVSSGGQSGHQRMSSQGSIGSPRHSVEEVVQHRPAKMTPVIPVTTEITKQISEQHKKAEQPKKAGAPMIQRVPPQQHPPRMQTNSSLTAGNMGSMELPPPPPDMMVAPSMATSQQSEFPPPPPSVETMTSQVPPDQSQTQDQTQSSSQSGSNRSSTSSAGLGMSPSSQSPRHSITQSPRHSLSRPPVPTPVATPVAPSPPAPPLPPAQPIQPPAQPAHNQMSMSMPCGPVSSNSPTAPPTGSVQHRRSSSGPSTPTHGGAKRPPPPPPRRSTTKLSVYGDSAGNKHFMADLQRVLHQKQDRSEQFMTVNPAPDFPPAPPPYRLHHQVSAPTHIGQEDFADLPPPPEELLEGLPGHEKRRPPPPPPKRHLQTQLSFSRGQIS